MKPDDVAREWIEAWNSHDLDRIMSHYDEGFEMRSPFIRTVVGEPSGMLRGKPAVRAYWERALALSPNLRFELVAVAAGVDSVAVNYRNQRGTNCIEVLEFAPSGKVTSARAHYAE